MGSLPTMSRHYDVFLSHSGADKEFVEQLSKELTQYEGDFGVFFDKNSIKYGEKISVILESARTCKLFVAVLSEDYFTRSKPPMMELAASYTASKDGNGVPCLLPIFLAIKPQDAKKSSGGWLRTWKVWAMNEKMSVKERDRISRVEPDVWDKALDALLMTRGPVYIPDENKKSPTIFLRKVAQVIAEKLDELSNITTVPDEMGEVMQGEKGKRVLEEQCPEVTGHEFPAKELSSLQQCSSYSQPLDERLASSSARVPTDVLDPLPTADVGAQPPHPGPPPPEPQPRQWDRRLRILVLGDSELVKTVVLHMCGDVKSASVQGHANLTESRSSSSPVCLYYDTSGRGNRVSTDIQSFVEARNKCWHLDQVKGLWKGNKHHRPVGERLALFHDSKERLHMVWYVCRTRFDLPSANLIWPEITEKLYGLPVQILVTGEQAPEDLTREHRDIASYRNDWFPGARNVEELIVKVALTDGDWKENLLRVCWTAKTRAEIGNAAKIITWMREKLGPEGKSDPQGVAVRISKSFSLSQSGELILNYLCTYWDHVDSQHLFFALRDTLKWVETNKGVETNKVIIQPVRGFVLFCLQVAAIILYSASNPEYGRVPAKLVKVKAQDCLHTYFQESSNPAAYDSMTLSDLQKFLESVFEGQDSVANSLMQRLSAEPEDRSSCSCLFMFRNRSVTPAR